MDLALPGDSHPARVAVRSWLEAHPEPTARELAEAGYVSPHWPRPWGLDAGPVDQLVIDEELRSRQVRRPFNPIGIGWAGPTLVHAGTAEQQERYLPPLLSGEEVWCQLFSEPGAGSDLAGLRTRATKDGDGWIVSGQKVWTTYAHMASFGILLARTDPGVAKHSGISYFICPMDAKGVTVRPIVDMTGDHAFNEVFFDDVHLGPGHLVGRPGEGWSLAKVTLSNERVSLSGEGALWGQGPTAGDLVEELKDSGGVADPVLRQRVASVWAESEVLRLVRLRTIGAVLQGREPGPEASIRKAMADDHGKKVMELARDLVGARAMLNGSESAGSPGPSPGPGGGPAHVAAAGSRRAARWPESTWAKGYLFSMALTIGGGTSEVQRNIVAERVLGLPHDIDLDAGRSFDSLSGG
ncbi:MAG: acyl-CoA dehydrogenase family protein [Acidimicrobiales bacterium]